MVSPDHLFCILYYTNLLLLGNNYNIVTQGFLVLVMGLISKLPVSDFDSELLEVESRRN